MSIFPTGRGSNGRHSAIADRDARAETDGALARPISGQIYLIDEADLASLSECSPRARLSGLISRH